MESNFKTFLSLMALVCLLACNEDRKKIDCSEIEKEYSQTAYDIKDKQATDKLISRLNNVIASSSCLAAYLMRADVNYALGNKTESLKDYKAAITIDTNSVYIFFKIAILFDLQEKYDSAVYYYSLSLEKKKIGDYVINYNTKFQKEMTGKANDVDYNMLKLRRGVAAYYLKDAEIALKDLSYCISSSYFLPDSYFYRGATYILLKEFKKACADLELAKEMGNQFAKDLIDKYCIRN